MQEIQVETNTLKCYTYKAFQRVFIIEEMWLLTWEETF